MSKYVIIAISLVYVAGECSGQVYKSHSVETAVAIKPAAVVNDDFITQTVYGFLDFTTTIGNTVMVFSPQSAPADGEKEKKISGSIIETKPSEKKEKAHDIQPSKTRKGNTEEETKKQAKGTKVVVNSVIEQNAINPADDNGTRSPRSQEPSVQMTKSPVVSSQVQVKSKDETPVVKNNLAEPEYDFLSKQPTEVVDETYKLINLRPSSKAQAKPRPTSRRDKENPTGLVTKLGGTIVKDGLTTVHETSVIGTYINGKYAQVLQSSSRILSGTPPIPEGKIRPSSTQRILKTIGPQQGKLKPQLEPTPTNQQEESSLPLEVLFNAPGSTVRSTRKNANPNSLRPKFRNKINDDYDASGEVQTKPNKNRSSTTPRSGYKNRSPPTTTTEPPVTRRRSGFRPGNQPSLPSKQINKNKNDQQPVSPNPVPKLKLPRTQGRWSYKTTPKPRIAIRKQVDVEEEQRSTLETGTTESSINLDDGKTTASSVSTSTTATTATTGQAAQRKIQEGVIDDELDPSESEDVASVSVQDQHAEQILPVETLNVEISTAADSSDVYFEIATIKSPYTFQVGTLRNTRYITVTSTQKKSFATIDPSSTILASEPLTENILANTAAAYETTLPLDSAVATLPAITLESGQATPPLETVTETFSTTQTLLKTHLLPVVHGGNTTTKLTLVQTYNIARVVTATKTLPPMDVYQFIPSKALNEFNSKLDEAGSELHLELDVGDDDRDDDDIPKRVVAPSSDMDSDLEPFKSISPSKTKSDTSSSTTEPQLTPDQLALLKYFGQPQPQVITTSRPVVVLDTLYESHVIPVVNNGNTIYSTLSRPVGTVPRTSYEYGTSTIAPVLPQPQIQPQLPPQLPLFPQQQPQFTITSSPLITQTLATVSDSRILKLTFGAKTAYTTLFSSRVVPTEITTYVTTTVPIHPTVSPFPAYYPPPVAYPPFPFVG
ncbi:mediator of DNA damage checkpoint protein 1 [Ceratina calcarata]|uniref:Mediator of DNA damage checkpoint protein 1 n=1 Tax=Ceratina calcarata TaxID=156304 RepID=A0AAJ7S4V8_9HYME|nr:mediator of DNA damage checkpoint protein 1 [Ceratina calcarata]XP_026671381.1 mediator of DNA damage checkpoint protein 1 [Ceratina calcarata]